MSVSRDQTFERVAAEVAKFFDVPAAEIKRSTVALDVDGWDSIRHTSLIMHLEDVFEIEFPEEKILAMGNVGEMSDTIAEVLTK